MMATFYAASGSAVCCDTTIARLHDDRYSGVHSVSDRHGLHERIMYRPTACLSGSARCNPVLELDSTAIFDANLIINEIAGRLSFFTLRDFWISEPEPVLSARGSLDTARLACADSPAVVAHARPAWEIEK